MKPRPALRLTAGKFLAGELLLIAALFAAQSGSAAPAFGIRADKETDDLFLALNVQNTGGANPGIITESEMVIYVNGQYKKTVPFPAGIPVFESMPLLQQIELENPQLGKYVFKVDIEYWVRFGLAPPIFLAESHELTFNNPATPFREGSLSLGALNNNPADGNTTVDLTADGTRLTHIKATIDGTEFFQLPLGDIPRPGTTQTINVITPGEAASRKPGSHTLTVTATAKLVDYYNNERAVTTTLTNSIYFPPPFKPPVSRIGQAANAEAQIAVDPEGRAHVLFYGAETNGGPQGLRYAVCEGDKCGSTPIGADQPQGPMSFVLDNAGAPHILYYSPTLTGQIKYASRNGSGWKIENIANNISATSILNFGADLAVDAAGHPHITYYNGSALIYTRRDASGNWAAINNLLQFQSTTRLPHALALNGAGRPFIAYGAGTQLYLGTITDGQWQPLAEAGANTFGPFHKRVALRLGEYDEAHVFTCNETAQYVQTFVRSGGFLEPSGGASSPPASIYAPNGRVSFLLDTLGGHQAFAMSGSYGALGHFSLQTGIENILGSLGMGSVNEASVLGPDGALHVAAWTSTADMFYFRATVPAVRGYAGIALKMTRAFPSDTEVEWSWDAEPEGTLGFRIYGGATNEGPFALLAGTDSLKPGARTYRETKPSGPHFRYVAAVTPGGEIFSNAVYAGLEPLAPDADAPLDVAYSYPNPAPPGVNPRFHIEAGIAESVDLHVYNLAGENVYQTTLTGLPDTIDNVYAYESIWDVSGVAPGIYRCVVAVKKSDGSEARRKFRFAVIK